MPTCKLSFEPRNDIRSNIWHLNLPVVCLLSFTCLNNYKKKSKHDEVSLEIITGYYYTEFNWYLWLYMTGCVFNMHVGVL